MKIVKVVLGSILGLIVLVLFVAAFSKKEYAVVREVVINKPKTEVYEYVKYLKNQDNFSVWAKMDPNMKKTFTGTDGTVGCISGWESTNENVGSGEQEIKGVVDGERIDFELRFKVPFESTSDAYMTTENSGENATLVKWGFAGKMPYPMNAMLLFMDMDKAIGKDFEEGLANLKVLLEK